MFPGVRRQGALHLLPTHPLYTYTRWDLNTHMGNPLCFCISKWPPALRAWRVQGSVPVCSSCGYAFLDSVYLPGSARDQLLLLVC